MSDDVDLFQLGMFLRNIELSDHPNDLYTLDGYHLWIIDHLLPSQRRPPQLIDQPPIRYEIGRHRYSENLVEQLIHDPPERPYEEIPTTAPYWSHK